MVKRVSNTCLAGLLGGVVSIANGPAGADSAIGIDNHLGNALHQQLAPPGSSVDSLGYSLITRTAFSPSGILYPLVFEQAYLQEQEQEQDTAGSEDDTHQGGTDNTAWSFSGIVEFGYLANFGTTDTARFREFADWDEGLILNRFAVTANNRRKGEYGSFFGGSLGRDDQYLRLDYGRRGAFDISAWFNQIPHTFSNNALVLWDGVGSGNLTLPGGLQPGASTASQVREVLADRARSTLALERKRGGLAVNLAPWKNIELFVTGSSEWRDGERPFGGTFNYPLLGQFTETVEPINYVTHELDVGMRYLGRSYQANLTYSGSFFMNDTPSLIWENPGLTPFALDFIPERGRFALPPDNRFHQFKADFAAILPFMQGRWTTSLAYNRKVQDQPLLPPTISTGIGNNTGIPVNFDLWNTTGALSRPTAEARIETMFAQAELTLQPTHRLRTTFELRYLDEDNDTDYTAFNPLTGEFGYIPEDGGFLFDDGIFQPGRPGDLLRIRGVPFARDDLRARINADYQLANRMQLGLSYTHLEQDYAHRERDDVRDDRLRLQLTDRSGPWASLRLAGEYARRSGDEFQLNPLAPFLSSVLPGFVPFLPDGSPPRELAGLRVFDLSSRDQFVADLQVRFNPGLRSDIAVTGHYQRDDFDAQFGLRARQTISMNAEWNYQFDDSGSGFVYYSFQAHDRSATGINDAGPGGIDPNAGGVVFPLDNVWRQALNETHHAAGIGFTRQWRKLLLEADYTFSYSNSRLGFDFASAGALSPGVDPAEAGSGFPNQTFRQHIVRISLRYPLTERIATRLFYRLEAEDINDFHFDGLTDPVLDNQLFLLAVPQDFTAHVLGVLVEVAL